MNLLIKQESLASPQSHQGKCTMAKNRAMDEEEFETLVHAAFEGLPDMYREACADLAIRTEALPDNEVMALLELSDPHQLLGLYHGINLAQKSSFDIPSMPNHIIIYRLPILAYSETNALPLEKVVRHVLVHEIGHHFGFSDADMNFIEST